MLFQYVGCGQDDPRVCKVFGLEFDLHGQPVEVADPVIAKKLSGNATFIVIAGDEEAAPVKSSGGRPRKEKAA